MNFKEHFDDVKQVENREVYLNLLNDGLYDFVSLKRVLTYEQIRPDVYNLVFIVDSGMVATDKSQHLFGFIDKLNADKEYFSKKLDYEEMEIHRIQPMGVISIKFTVEYTPSKKIAKLMDTEMEITSPKYTQPIWLDLIEANSVQHILRVSYNKYLTEDQFRLFASMTIRDSKNRALQVVKDNLLEFSKAAIKRL